METFYRYAYKAIHHSARKQEGLSVKNYEGSWEREDSLNWLKKGTSEHNSTNIGNLYKKMWAGSKLEEPWVAVREILGKSSHHPLAKQWGKNMDGE